MLSPQLKAVLYCLAGVAFIIAGFIMEMRSPELGRAIMIVVGVGYFALAWRTIREARSRPPGPNIPKSKRKSTM